jgi:hypothetical protein
MPITYELADRTWNAGETTEEQEAGFEKVETIPSCDFNSHAPVLLQQPRLTLHQAGIMMANDTHPTRHQFA